MTNIKIENHLTKKQHSTKWKTEHLQTSLFTYLDDIYPFKVALIPLSLETNNYIYSVKEILEHSWK